MAVQTAPEIKITSPIGKQMEQQNSFLSFSMAALGFANPWRRSDEGELEINPHENVLTLAEVAQHDSPNDCWVIIYDRVYDITSFIYEHPGGGEILLECGGQDASIAFRSSGHSKNAIRALERFLIGELPMHERLYRRPGGIRLSDIPD